MVASSFTSTPGLPILQSSDLVHWKLISYALDKIVPIDYYQKVHHGAGVWAPSIRYHAGEFYIYYPDPDMGIYMVKTKNILGKWSTPILVEGGKGLIDPCPLWDDDGKVFLVHAYAGSRAGIKSVLVMKQMNTEGTKTIEEGKLVYDGHEIDPTVEGPKLYKYKGWYYIFAPAGGVTTGWQIVLRSKNIYGPYERKKVMEQGTSKTNGPHQGGWVQTNTGEDWFLHFQDKGAYGRITHLQPMVWKNGWPVIGEDMDGDGIGQPVDQYKMPSILNASILENKTKEASKYQWNVNPASQWRMSYGDVYRQYAIVKPDSIPNLWNFPALYLQKIPAESFEFTSSINFTSLQKGERAGFILFGKSYASIELKNDSKGLQLNYIECIRADKGTPEQVIPLLTSGVSQKIFFRLSIKANALAQFSYSLDGKKYITIPKQFQAEAGVWVGAKMGYYCISDKPTNDAGFMVVEN